MHISFTYSALLLLETHGVMPKLSFATLGILVVRHANK